MERLYGGDYDALCRDYFALVEDVVRKTGCRIVGHFDLVTKFNEKYHFFEEDQPSYQEAALQALHSLLDQGALLEINTGALSRGWKSSPYPADFLLKEVGRLGGTMIHSSDAHRAEDLLDGLPQAAALAENYGISLAEDPF